MSVISVPVVDARALVDADAGTFTLEARLANGREVRFRSTPTAELLSELLDAMKAPAPEPETTTAKPRRTRKKKEATAS